MASIADRLGVSGEHELVIGSSFNKGNKGSAFHSVRCESYDDGRMSLVGSFSKDFTAKQIWVTGIIIASFHLCDETNFGNMRYV